MSPAVTIFSRRLQLMCYALVARLFLSVKVSNAFVGPRGGLVGGGQTWPGKMTLKTTEMETMYDLGPA